VLRARGSCFPLRKSG